MTTQIDTNWHYRGLQVIRLENELLRVDVLPEVGAKVWNLVYKPLDRNLLWQNRHLPPARQSFGVRFDDVWSGGWDELLPNDVPTQVSFGELLPDHGEVWSQVNEWEVVENRAERVAVRFSSYGRVWPTRFEKIISLRARESLCRVLYRYTNFSTEPIDFLWNIHPAMPISPATRLDVPAVSGLTDPWGTGQFAGWTEYTWPYAPNRAGKVVDVRAAPSKGDQADFHYFPHVAAGWYAVTDTRWQLGFGLVFPTKVFPHLWLFRSAGGWRGLYMLILEASTGYPNDLAVARAQGHCAHLDAGETLEAEVSAVVYTGVTAVQSIEPDGQVIPRLATGA